MNNLRFDLQIIASWIAPGSRVLSLGCGEGDLLLHLKKHRQVRASGIEIAESKVATCIDHGLSVIQGDISAVLPGYPDKAFDYVILSQTLQQVYHPLAIISEMMRVGQKGVVSFPNFSHWGIRAQLLLTGRAPMTDQLPYDWHDTPNIRTITINDFKRFARKAEVNILTEAAINTANFNRKNHIIRRWPNLRATYGIFLISRE